MTAALAAGVGQRVLDGIHSPALVVEERVVEDAADRELRIVLDRVALEVLVATFAVDKPDPVGIPPADPSAQRQPGGSGLDVEWFVVLDRADRRLEGVGLAPLSPGVKNPLPWLAEQMDIKRETNFFEGRVTEYQKASALALSSDDDL
jgi:hypothetical protein